MLEELTDLKQAMDCLLVKFFISMSEEKKPYVQHIDMSKVLLLCHYLLFKLRNCLLAHWVRIICYIPKSFIYAFFTSRRPINNRKKLYTPVIGTHDHLLCTHTIDRLNFLLKRYRDSYIGHQCFHTSVNSTGCKQITIT